MVEFLAGVSRKFPVSWLGRFRSHDRMPAGLYTDVLGKGEKTIEFIPGLGGTTRYWQSRVRPLENRYQVVLVDLLGFGQSPKPWTQYTVERQVQELYAVLQPFGRISLVGHSLGALITVAYACRHPAHVKIIVLIGMPYFGSQRRAYRYMRQGSVKSGYLFTNVVLAMVACILTRRVFGKILPYLIRSVSREVAEDLVTHTWRSSTSSMWEVVYRYDVAEDLRHLAPHIDVLCIHGDQDLMAPVAAIEKLMATHPRWRLCVLPGVDHHPFLRDPNGCLALVTAKEEGS